MDWIAINTGCFAISNTIAKTSFSIHGLVREVRESRSDLDAISSELHSLESVVDLLKDETASLPTELASKTPVVLEHCNVVVNQLDAYIAGLNDSELPSADKKLRWIATRKQMTKLKSTLEEYKLALGLALDLTTPTIESRGGVDSSPAGETSAEIFCSDIDVKHELSMVTAGKAVLAARLQAEFRLNNTDACLQDYLRALQTHIEASGLKLEIDQNEVHRAPSSNGDAPDSAIDMGYDVVFDASKEAPRQEDRLPIEQINELLDKLEEVPERPPTPPPKALARMSSMRSSISQSPRSPSAAGSSIAEERKPSIDAEQQLIERMNAIRQSTSSSSSSYYGSVAGESLYTTVTKIGADNESVTSSRPPSRMSRFIAQIARPATPSVPDAPKRRRSLRLSMSLAMPTLRRFDDIPEEETPEPDEIFGVSLQKSMKIASSSAKAHHNGSGSSRRDFPLCVMKCYSYIKQVGVETPGIFAGGSDPELLHELKETFSTGPSYGEDVEMARFGVCEAADLLILYLSLLPKPLLPESVAKRWISMSRQATQPGSHAVRLEQCIDFWEEALGGIRGSAKNLFKLLLNLWADVADAAEANEMTAERLAGRVIRPLMHLPANKHDTDLMLGLAFIIRKRSEYSMLLRGDKGSSNAAF